MSFVDNITTAMMVGIYSTIADVILLRYIKHYINTKFPVERKKKK